MDSQDLSGGQPAFPAELPAAALRLWIDGEGSAAAWEAAQTAVGLEPGVRAVSPGLFVVLPVPGDPAVFDTALRLGQRAHRAAPELRALVHPVRARTAREACEPLSDPLSRDLEARLPLIDPGQVHLTSRSAQMLERPPQLGSAASYRGPSGRSVPFLSAGPPRPADRPWRNRELFGRALPTVHRSTLVQLLEELLQSPVGALVGPLGSGKSRLAWEHLRRADHEVLWLSAEADRGGRYSLAEQAVHRAIELTRRLEKPRGDTPGRHSVFDEMEEWRSTVRLRRGKGTSAGALTLIERLMDRAGRGLRIVVDDLAQAGDDDLDFVHELCQLAGPAGPRLLLIARSVGNGLERLADVPVLEVPPMEEAEIDRVCSHAIEGLSLPKAVKGRFLEAVAGYPFALEEGLLALIHGRTLRRVYGSFFFGGADDAAYEPSERLTRHLWCEAGRLEAMEPARVLALTEAGAPRVALNGASELPAATGWDGRLLDARLLRRIDTPWGVGLEFECSAYRAALRGAVPIETSVVARRRLGRQLSARANSGEAHWEAYRLLQGSPGGIGPLLAAGSSAAASTVSRQRLLATLTRELAAHRARTGSEETELELLWRILPLARRLGQLHEFADEIGRAVSLSGGQPSRLLAVATLKAELDREAGRFQEAETTIHRALKAASGEDRRRQALLLIQLGRLFLRQGRYDEAERLFDNLLEAVEEDRLAALAATCRFFLGNIALHKGRIADSFELHRGALEERRRLGLERPVGTSLCALGAVSISLGNYPQALTYYRRALTVLEHSGRGREISFALLGLGNVFSRLGDFTGATRPLRRALELREDRDDVLGEAIARLALARNHLDLGWLDSALEHTRQARFQLRLASAKELLADSEQLMGRIRHRRRETASARERFEAAEAMHRGLRDLEQAALDRSWLLELALAQDEMQDIERHVAALGLLLFDLEGHDWAEVLEFRLYRGLERLQQLGVDLGDPRPHLERAYRELLDQAAHLTPPQRHRFLQQIPIHGEIVRAASHGGLEPPRPRDEA